MKVLVIFFFVISTCMAFEFPMKVRGYMEECAKENKIDPSTIKFGQQIDPKLAKTKPYKCLVHCISLKAGFVNNAGDFNGDKLKSSLALNDETVDNIMQCAKENKQSDKCNRSYAITECAKKRVKGLFPQ